MNTVKTVKEGVQVILDYLDKKLDTKWEYIPASENDLADKLIIEGKEYPLFWWRYDNTLFPMEENGKLLDPVSCKLNLVTTKSYGLDKAIIKEFDIAEWFLDSETKKFNCFMKGSSAEILVTMQNEKVAILELASTLADGTVHQGRHTLWGREGMTSDKVVSQKDTPQALYLYSDKSTTPTTYNDVFYTLYGLCREDVIRVSIIVEILLGKYDPEPWIAKFEKFKKFLSMAKKSSESGEPYIVEEK